MAKCGRYDLNTRYLLQVRLSVRLVSCSFIFSDNFNTCFGILRAVHIKFWTIFGSKNRRKHNPIFCVEGKRVRVNKLE